MPIVVNNLSFTYMPKTPFEKLALDDISLTIEDNQILGIIGSTGSGKSTFIQHLNGLLKMQKGLITVDDISLNDKKPNYKALRRKVGMVFQYPEYQLFEDSVKRDIEFGAKNIGLEGEELDRKVRESMAMVGLDYNTFAERSPFELSGGQKRRVAIAGILAMSPEILILDEPTAGLDPNGKKEVLSLVRSLRGMGVKTIIIISHDMNEISSLADTIAVFHQAKLQYHLPVKTLFEHGDDLISMGLDIPETIKIAKMLNERGYNLPTNILSLDELTMEIMKAKGGTQ